MKTLGVIIAASLILCVLRIAVVGLIFAVVGLLLWGVFFRSAETFGLLIFCLFVGLLQNYPTIGLAIASQIVVILSVMRWRDRGRVSNRGGEDVPRSGGGRGDKDAH